MLTTDVFPAIGDYGQAGFILAVLIPVALVSRPSSSWIINLKHSVPGLSAMASRIQRLAPPFLQISRGYGLGGEPNPLRLGPNDWQASLHLPTTPREIRRCSPHTPKRAILL